ncbi:MAG: DUF881 domain-containing protein [Jiangellaceae bacterium]
MAARGGWRFAAPVALALCGALMAISARAADGTDLRPSRNTELSDLVRAQERRGDELAAELERLGAEVEELTAEKGDVNTDDLQAQIEALEPAAGLTAVHGPALSVTLDDAPLPDDDRELAPGTVLEDYLIHQEDLEGVINALWAGGAEAMMVMDQRVVSTSNILCVGSSLLLHGGLYAPPYTISAIGDVDAMARALGDSEAVIDFRQWADFIGLGYRVESDDEMTLPAYEGPIDVAGATP